MTPFTCPNGNQHSYDSTTFVCTNCGTYYKEVYDATQTINSLVDRIKSLMSHPTLLPVALYTALTRSNRGVQQSFINDIAKFINLMKDAPVDEKNEAAISWCKKVSEVQI
jgi:hypothetical protein